MPLNAVSKKQKELEDYRLIKKLLTQYKTDEGVTKELNAILTKIEGDIRFMVNEKIKNRGIQSTIYVGEYSAEEYLGFLHDFLINFYNETDENFNVEYLKEKIYWNDFEEFSQPSVYADRSRAYNEVADSLPTMIRLMQSLRLLRTQEITEVTKLYQDLTEPSE